MIDIQPIDVGRDDQNIITQQFMKELCRGDDEANKNMNPDIKIPHNEFDIKDIQEKVLDGYRLDDVVNALRGYENEDDPYIELTDSERKEKIRLTNAGRAHCGEFGL
jgi:hypothetical protein